MFVWFLGIIVGDIVKIYEEIFKNFEKILEEFRKILKNIRRRKMLENFSEH